MTIFFHNTTNESFILWVLLFNGMINKFQSTLNDQYGQLQFILHKRLSVENSNEKIYGKYRLRSPKDFRIH